MIAIRFADSKRFIISNIQRNKGNPNKFGLPLFGRDDRIRTCDFYVPNVALYQTEPHLVFLSAIYYIIHAAVCQ